MGAGGWPGAALASPRTSLNVYGCIECLFDTIKLCGLKCFRIRTEIHMLRAEVMSIGQSCLWAKLAVGRNHKFFRNVICSLRGFRKSNQKLLSSLQFRF